MLLCFSPLSACCLVSADMVYEWWIQTIAVHRRHLLNEASNFLQVNWGKNRKPGKNMYQICMNVSYVVWTFGENQCPWQYSKHHVLGGITHNPWHPQQRIVRLKSLSQVKHITEPTAVFLLLHMQEAKAKRGCFWIVRVTERAYGNTVLVFWIFVQNEFIKTDYSKL